LVAYPITDSALRWLEVILAERFGQAWQLAPTAEGLRLQLAGAEGAILFDTLCEGFTQAHSDQPFTRWDAEREGWASVLGGPLPAPGVAELPSPLIEPRGAAQVIHYDILGLTYWMLARVEEIGRTDLDNHGRFPATASHAFKHGYLDRPVVDEWLHLLGQVIQRQWPGVEFKRHEFSIKVSHDVDRPSRYGFASPKNLVRRMVGDLARRDLKSALQGPWIRLRTQNSLHPADPFNTFDWIMDLSERYGLVSAFYFICGRSGRYDAEYEIEHPAMRDLLRRIHARGLEIGLHPSYDCFDNRAKLKEEAERLWSVCAQAGIQQSEWGGRMHYLRWRHPDTMRIWNDTGMNYDSTLTYADHAGFRCGTCYEYPGYDVLTNKQLEIRVCPLVAMEASVLGENYMAIKEHYQAAEVFLGLKRKCEQVGGVFSLLWHNSEVVQKGPYHYLYEALLASN